MLVLLLHLNLWGNGITLKSISISHFSFLKKYEMKAGSSIIQFFNIIYQPKLAGTKLEMRPNPPHLPWYLDPCLNSKLCWPNFVCINQIMLYRCLKKYHCIVWIRRSWAGDKGSHSSGKVWYKLSSQNNRGTTPWNSTVKASWSQFELCIINPKSI